MIIKVTKLKKSFQLIFLINDYFLNVRLHFMYIKKIHCCTLKNTLINN